MTEYIKSNGEFLGYDEHNNVEVYVIGIKYYIIDNVGVR